MTEDEAQRMREMDEGMTRILDSMPRLWWGMYQRCKEEGFTESQAMDIVKTYITTLVSGSR